MKKPVALICMMIAWQPVWTAQFQNLDFDAGRTNLILPIPPDEGDGYGPVGDLLPGWRLLQGTNDISLIGLNLNPISLGVASIYGANSRGFDAPVLGTYSLGLYPGFNLLFQYQPFSLIQVGDIGAEVRSIRFINYGSPFQLSLNGTLIPLIYDYQPGGPDPDNRLAVVMGDVSAFAGQTVELRFATLDLPGSVINGLENVEFSAQAVPEPGGVALLLTGGLLLRFQMRRRQNRATG
jgi:hypothetical protein